MASASALVMSLFAVLTFASAPINGAHGCGINIVNGCPYEVTACAQSSNNLISQFNLGSGAQQFLDIGSSCGWPAGVIWASVTGQCAVTGSPSTSTDRNLANVAEFILAPNGDFYDLNNINAYNIGLSIVVTSPVQEKVGSPRCGTITCVISDIRAFCQGDNQLVTLPSGALSCINTDGTAGLGPTPNTELFKAACPEAVAYSDPDDDRPSPGCGNGSTYQVTFCPGGITMLATN